MNIYDENIDFKPKKNVKVDEKYVLKLKKVTFFSLFLLFKSQFFEKYQIFFKNSKYTNLEKVLGVRKIEIWEIR